MGFSVYWCSRLNGHIEYIETTAYGVYELRGISQNSVLKSLIPSYFIHQKLQ
jgi:hypothetical protein